jgi:hypothetical protein
VIELTRRELDDLCIRLRYLAANMMFTQIVQSFARLLPHSRTAAPVHVDDEQGSEDSRAGWHASSWELTRGLQVIEVSASQRDLAALFPDTQPAFHDSDLEPLEPLEASVGAACAEA